MKHKQPETTENKAENLEAELDDLFSRLRLDGLAVTIQDPESTDNDKANALVDGLKGIMDGIVTQHSTWKQAGTNRMPIVLNDRLTVHVLMNFDTKTLSARGMAVLIGDQWLDAMTLDENDTGNLNEFLSDENLDRLMNMAYNLFFGNGEPVETAQIRMIPTKGLENVQLHETTEEESSESAESQQETESRDEQLPAAA